MIKTLFFALAVLSSTAHAVTNGKLSTDDRFSAVRSFGMVVNGRLGSCTGTFISKRQFLTAAHCLEFMTKQPSTALYIAQFPLQVYGHLGFSTRAYSYKAFVHPSFIREGVRGDSSDAAVIAFSTDMSETFIPVSYSPVVKNEKLVMTGYGCDKATKVERNDFQIGAELVADLTPRRVILKKSETMLCPGDSGGPVLKVAADQSLTIVGINSYYHPIGRFFGKSADRVTRLDDGSSGSIRNWLSAIEAGQLKPDYEVTGF